MEPSSSPSRDRSQAIAGPVIRHGRIDVHHHIFPPAHKAENARRGITEEAGVRIPDWRPRQSLDVMNANGIQTAILSLSAPGVYFGDKTGSSLGSILQ